MSSRQAWLTDDHDGACEFSYRRVGRDAPRFSDFRVPAERIARPARPQIAPEFRLFRTQIRRAARQGPNFAGRYTFAEWGVGTGRCWAIIDNRTGIVSGDDKGRSNATCLTTEGSRDQEPQFRADSRLLILSGHLGEDRVGVGYYVWTGKRLRKVRFYAWDELCPRER